MELQCLLCLKLNTDLVNCIDIYSEEWREQNIESLIEKHLWPMATLKSNSPWLCSTCWKALHEFHQFYRQIEDVQSFFDYFENSEQNIHIEECEVTEFLQDNLDETSTVGETVTAMIASDDDDSDTFSVHESQNDVQENGFKCQYCLKDLKDRQALLNHLAWHDGYMKQQRPLDNSNLFVKSGCNDQESKDICSDSDLEESREYISQEEESGQSGSHSNSKIFKCCRLVKDQRLVLKHRTWHKGNMYNCQICDLQFLDKSKLEHHKLLHTSRGKSPNHDDATNNIPKPTLSGSVSSTSFQSVENMVQTKLSITCKYCSKVLEDQRALTYHIAWHKRNIYTCEICDLKFFDLNKFKSHKSAHTIKRGTQFNSVDETSELHTVSHELEIDEDESDTRTSTACDEELIFQCVTCDLKFADAAKFNNHKSTHSSKRNSCCNSKGEIECALIEEKQEDVDHLYQEELINNESEWEKGDDGEGESVCEGVDEGDCKGDDDGNGEGDADGDGDGGGHGDGEGQVEYEDETDTKSSISINLNCNLKIKKVKCKFCSKDIKNVRVLLNHKAWHEGETFHCNACELKFFDKSKFEDHKLAHTLTKDTPESDNDDSIPQEYFVCKFCSKVLNSRRLFINHNAWHIGNIQQCDICDMKFCDKFKYDSHVQIHITEPLLPCPDCGKTFSCDYEVRRHQDKMHRNMDVQVCDICGKSYRCPISFKRHINKHNGNPEPKLPCDICGRLLKGKNSLKSHKLIMHPKSGILPYVCDICLKPLATRSILNRHVVLAHTALGDQKCTVCGKSFKTMSDLKRHSNIHTADTKYTCAWCPHKFYASSALSRHKMKVHPKEYEEWKSNLYVQL